MNLLTEPLWRRAAAVPLWLLVLATASGTLSLHILVPALPFAAKELAVSEGTIQQTITFYVAGLAGGQLVYGPLSDRFGRRPVLLFGLALYMVGGIAGYLATDVHTLILARIAQALGGCGGLVLGRAIMRDVAEPKQAAARLALLNLVVSAGPALAPLAGGYMTAYLGWRSSLALMAVTGAVALVATLFLLPETATFRSRGDAAGAMARDYWRLVASPQFRNYAIGGACTTTSFYAYLAASPFIFIDLLHRPVEEVGLYFILVFSGVTLGSFIANRLIRRVSPAGLARAANGLAVVGAGLFFAAAVSDRLSIAAVLGPMLLFTIGCGITSPLALTGAISTSPRTIGAASGLYGFIQMAFGALCTLLVSLWPANGAIASSSILLASALGGQWALILATRRKFGTAD